MSFWTGLEAFTGHQPGAFTGMTMKGLFDKDMWDRLPQTWSGKMGTEAHLKANPMDRRTNRAGEPMTTNWARGGGGQTPRPVPQPAFSSPMQPEGALAGPSQYPQMFPYKRQDVQAEALQVPGWTPPRNPAETIQEIGPYWGMGDPYSGWGGYLGSAKNAHMGMGASGYKVPQAPQYDSTMEQMLDMTTVRKVTDDASPNTITQTVKQKVPANPTKTLMNMNQPGFLERLGSGIGEQWGNLWDASILRRGTGAWDAMKSQLDEQRRKRFEDSMKARRGY